MILRTLDIINRLKKHLKVDLKPGRIIDAGEWVTDGYILLKKNLEPSPWKRYRYEDTLEQEKVAKITSKFNDTTTFVKLELTKTIDLEHPDYFELLGPDQKTYVNPRYLVLLTQIFIWGRTPLLRFNELNFLQKENEPKSEIFLINKERELLGVLMPMIRHDL